MDNDTKSHGPNNVQESFPRELTQEQEMNLCRKVLKMLEAENLTCQQLMRVMGHYQQFMAEMRFRLS